MTPLMVFTLAWAAGILLAQAARFPLIWLLLAIPTALVLLIGWGDQRGTRTASVALVGLMLGSGRLAVAQPRITQNHIAAYNNAGQVLVQGVVSAEPDRRPTYTNLRLDVEEVTLPDGTSRPVHGRLLVKAPAYTPARYGDRILVEGLLEEPPVFEAFSYKDYLARQGVYALLRDADVRIVASHQGKPYLEALYRFKERALDVLLSLLPEPQASLSAGILLGVETGIPDDLDEAFSTTGTSHIVAISGFNLTIIAGVFAALARRLLGRRGEAPVAMTGVWLYTLLVGASAAVLRAAAMATVAIWARREERKTHGLTSLAAAALLMTALNPYVLWDVGFQLSLAATLGLILYTDPLTRLFLRFFARFTHPERAERIVGWLSDALIVTLAAQITTTPIIVGVFHRLSLITLLTNFLILPVQSFVMLFGGVALVAGLLLRPAGQLLAWLAWVFLTYTIEIVRWTAQIPFASVELGRVTLPLVWGYNFVLLAGTWWFSRPVEARRAWLAHLRSLAQWQVAVGTAMLALFFAYLYTAPDGRLHVRFLDVGQGDAVFVQTPQGRQVLIDGGPDAPRLLSEIGRAMPFWDRRLDMVILTSPDEDRLAGLVPVLERYKVDFVWVGAEAGEGSVYDHWSDLLAARSPGTVGTLWAGATWDLDRDVRLRALWPEPGGEEGPTVLQLTYRDTRFLLAGDATTVVEESLAAREGRGLRSAVLQLARHGAQTSSVPVFLQAVDPEAVVISVAADNAYGGPSPVVLARVMDKRVYRTDRQGSVEITSDGRQVRVHTERNQ